MLKYRLIFGTLMVLCFIGLILLGARFDGSLSAAEDDDSPVQGSLFCLLIVLVAFLAVAELAGMARRKNARVFTLPAVVFSIVLATSWYWRQFTADPLVFQLFYVLFGVALCMAVIFFCQAFLSGTSGVIVNCAVNYFTIFYLGFLSSFILGVRIDFGPWAVLMYIFTVKFADTGAYTVGRLFGKHKLAPRISPGKTWEGMCGAVLFGIVTAVGFAFFCGIMPWYYGTVFGGLFAFLGQAGDLAESMIKRDAEEKDSSANIPGFGGVLDIVDSPLGAAPAAYAFFMVINC